MDRQARKLAIIRSTNLTEEGTPTSDHGSEMGSNTDSESDDKVICFFVWCYLHPVFDSFFRFIFINYVSFWLEMDYSPGY